MMDDDGLWSYDGDGLMALMMVLLIATMMMHIHRPSADIYGIVGGVFQAYMRMLT